MDKAHGLLNSCLIVSTLDFFNTFSVPFQYFSVIHIFTLQNPHPTGPTEPPTTTPPTTTTPAPETRQVFVRVIDASKNTLIPSVNYSYTVDQDFHTDNAATGEFTLTVPLNYYVELTVRKAGFYDNVQSDLIDEDKNWLIVMIPSVTIIMQFLIVHQASTE